ncbi:unnamed protein product [Rhizophagus irregularis]|nr:unnamed protein product [Rhizophagus irregularis]
MEVFRNPVTDKQLLRELYEIFLIPYRDNGQIFLQRNGKPCLFIRSTLDKYFYNETGSRAYFIRSTLDKYFYNETGSRAYFIRSTLDKFHNFSG